MQSSTIFNSLIIALGIGTLGCGQAVAASAAPRATWVVNQLYGYNHPFAAQLPGELATKMSKMTASPFAFYRGTAHLFYQDIKTAPASNYCNVACTQTWIDGDMHLQNIGGFRDANGNTVFDSNDFDEAYWGPYLWDVKRMAVSIVLAAQENKLSASNQQQLVRDFLDSYINKIGDFRGNDSELGYRLTASNTSGVVKDTIQLSAAQTTSALLSKYTSVVGGKRVFKTSADLVQLSSNDYRNVQTAIADYVGTIAASKRYASAFYTVKDVRLKLGSGVGSLGRYRYYVLIEGSGTSNSDDVILQVKQEVASAVAIANAGNLPGYVYDNHQGERVAKSMKASLSNTDVLVGWCTINGLPYFVREKSPSEADFDTSTLDTVGKFSTAVQYAGKVVAKNHATSDKDYDASLIAYSIDKEIDSLIQANQSGFKTEIVNFALNYANQVQFDYQSFLNAYQGGVALY
jgi:uncharacterized protein (DUF2252 family)